MPEAVSPKAGWTTVAFGDVIKKVTDKIDPYDSGLERYVAGEHMDTDDLRIRRWGQIGADYLGPAFHMRFKPGQVLYGSRRTYLRKVALADFEGITANTTFILESKDPEILLPALVPFIMQTERFHEHSKKESKGSVNPYVNFSDLDWYEFALPPIADQKKIVRLMQQIQSSLEALFNLINTTQSTKLALFEYLISAKKPDRVPLGDLLLSPPRNGCSPAESPSPTGHWVLALSAITKWGYEPDQLKPVELSDALKASTLQRGDLAVSRSNTRDLVGLPMVFPEERTDISYPDTMMRLSFDQKSVSTNFMEMCLRSPVVRREIKSHAAGTSASMKKINGKNLQKVLVPRLPIVQQEEILAQVEGLNRAVKGATIRWRDAGDLKRQLLEKSLIEQTPIK